MRMLKFLLLPTLCLCILIILFISGCDCKDDDISDPADDDDDNNDDSNDDDDDDNNNNDNDDNDDEILEDPFGYPPDDGQWFGDVFIQQVDCGTPGEHKTSMAIGSDDTLYVVAEKGGILFLYQKSPSDEKWTREKIDYFGDYADIAVDQNGDVHVAYTDARDTEGYLQLKYAFSSGEGWEITVVDDQGERVGERPAISIDQENFAHISYGDFWDNSVRYATNSSGIWTTEFVITGTPRDYGFFNDITNDADGFVHLISTEENFADPYLIYATNKTGSWDTEVVNSGSYAASLAVDQDGYIHIARTFMGFPSGNHVLKYTNNVYGAWISVTVDNEDFKTGYYPSIALDEQGHPHIAYGYASSMSFTSRLSYATNTSGSWIYERVDEIGGDGWYSSIALDSSGNVFAVHHDKPELSLEVSSLSQGNQWSTEVIDEGHLCGDANIALNSEMIPAISYGRSKYNPPILVFALSDDGVWTRIIASNNGGQDNSLDFDPDESAHISHMELRDIDDRSLLYSTNQSGHWETEVLEDSYYINRTDIKADNNGAIHIVYTDFCANYITNKSGEWVNECVHPEENNFGSIVIDSDNHVHVVFNHREDYYGFNESGSWEITQIDDVGAIYSALDIDSKGNAHISYHQNDSVWLKYATNSEGSWDTEELRQDYRGENDLVVDDADRVHIMQGGTYLMKEGDEWSETTVFPDSKCYFVIEGNSWIHAVCNIISGILYVKFPAGYGGG